MEKYRSFTGVFAAMTLLAIGAGCSVSETDGDLDTADQAMAKTGVSSTVPYPTCPPGEHQECSVTSDNASADTQTPPVCECVPDAPLCPCPEGQHEECSLIANATANTQYPPVCECVDNVPLYPCGYGEHQECNEAPDACTPPTCECIPDAPPCPRDQQRE